MKKTIFNITLVLLMVGAMLTSCQSSTNKVKDAKENMKDAEDDMVEAKQELDQAINDSIKQFKRESELKISAFEKSIIDFKAKIASGQEETKAVYEKKLDSLEQRKNELKKKLEDFKEERQDNWSEFKSEFNHDMDEIGKAFKDLTVNNIK